MASFARDSAAFSGQSGKPLVVTTPRPQDAAVFAAAGVAGVRRGRRGDVSSGPAAPPPRADAQRPSRAATAAAADAFDRLGGVPAVVKGCSPDVPHKRMSRLGVEVEGVLVARIVEGLHELMAGAHIDPFFGPLVVLGTGGKYAEAVPDTQLLLPPLGDGVARRAIGCLRYAPALAGVRGEPLADVGAFADIAGRLGTAMIAPGSAITSVDANPVVIGPARAGATIVNAVVFVAEAALRADR